MELDTGILIDDGIANPGSVAQVLPEKLKSRTVAGYM